MEDAAYLDRLEQDEFGPVIFFGDLYEQGTARGEIPRPKPAAGTTGPEGQPYSFRDEPRIARINHRLLARGFVPLVYIHPVFFFLRGGWNHQDMMDYLKAARETLGFRGVFLDGASYGNPAAFKDWSELRYRMDCLIVHDSLGARTLKHDRACWEADYILIGENDSNPRTLDDGWLAFNFFKSYPPRLYKHSKTTPVPFADIVDWLAARSLPLLASPGQRLDMAEAAWRKFGSII